MVQLNRSMMERYEIEDRRPQTLRAAIFGADCMMLGVAARLLDAANARGGDLGAVCFTRAAQALRAQDGMFTLLVRGEGDDGSPIREERVVQSIIAAVDPEAEFDSLLEYARSPELEMIFLCAACDAVELALAARFLYAAWQAGRKAPAVILPGAQLLPDCAENARSAMAAIARGWADGEAFCAWLREAAFQPMLAESLCGALNDAEAARARHDMNYRDDFIAWAEPQLKCTIDGEAPGRLAAVCAVGDLADACHKKERVFDAAVFLCAAAGYLSGMDTFSQTLRDEQLRAWIGHAFFDELLPRLPYPREEIAPCVISAFNRLENAMNEMPLLEIGRGLLASFPRAVLPAIRAHADREFEAPARLSLALSAAIMLYAGVRRDERGEYAVERGDARHVLHDDPEILEAFSRLAHDMPAESLAYAALADRAIWGADLREIDGLELRVTFNLSSIQRIGFRETLRIQEENQ